MNLLVYQAFARIPIGIAIAIEILGPLGVVLASARRVIDFVWFVLAFVGLCLFLPLESTDASLDLVGILFAWGLPFRGRVTYWLVKSFPPTQR